MLLEGKRQLGVYSEVKSKTAALQLRSLERLHLPVAWSSHIQRIRPSTVYFRQRCAAWRRPQTSWVAHRPISFPGSLKHKVGTIREQRSKCKHSWEVHVPCDSNSYTCEINSRRRAEGCWGEGSVSSVGHASMRTWTHSQHPRDKQSMAVHSSSVLQCREGTSDKISRTHWPVSLPESVSLSRFSGTLSLEIR